MSTSCQNRTCLCCKQDAASRFHDLFPSYLLGSLPALHRADGEAESGSAGDVWDVHVVGQPLIPPGDKQEMMSETGASTSNIQDRPAGYCHLKETCRSLRITNTIRGLDTLTVTVGWSRELSVC